MKPIMSLLLGLIILQVGCGAEGEDSINNSRPRGVNLVSVRFVDEVGNNRLDHLKLEESNGYYQLDRSQYTLDRWLNGKALGPEPEIVPAVPELGNIVLPFTIETTPSDRESVWIYTLEFVCPKLFGDDLVHIFVIEKKGKNLGLVNNFERLLFDGKVIATNMEGNEKEGYRAPFVIVVPQK